MGNILEHELTHMFAKSWYFWFFCVLLGLLLLSSKFLSMIPGSCHVRSKTDLCWLNCLPAITGGLACVFPGHSTPIADISDVAFTSERTNPALLAVAHWFLISDYSDYSTISWKILKRHFINYSASNSIVVVIVSVAWVFSVLRFLKVNN